MRRILVVDDDPHICQAIGIWLRQHGFRVSVSDGGVSGLTGCNLAEAMRSKRDLKGRIVLSAIVEVSPERTEPEVKRRLAVFGYVDVTPAAFGPVAIRSGRWRAEPS